MTTIVSGSSITFNDNTTQNTSAYGGGFAFRNRIINGDCRIDQRNAGAAVTTTSSYPVDRFWVSNTTDGAFSAQQDTSAPAGFINSVKITTTTADASLTTTQHMAFVQSIEGTNVADLAWGTASAKTVTLSFWVRSSLTGTFGGSLRNSGLNRSYPFTYTISVADTWEYKTIIIAGDTSGTWLTTTGIGISILFGLGVGPDRSGTAGSWNSNNNISATGTVSVVGTNGATFYITGVQLEKGSTATSFDYRPYGQELALCQRYWQQSYTAGTVAGTATQVGAADILPGTNGTGTMGGFTYFRVEMRAVPTITLYDLAGASGKVYKGGNGKTGILQNQATTGFTGYTTDATSASEMLYQWTASIEL
jgi:hypothetical protein